MRVSTDTWVLIEQLCAILEEFEVATTELEGHGAHGYHGSLYECLPSMEDLLGKLETLRKLHPTKDDRQQLLCPAIFLCFINYSLINPRSPRCVVISV